MADNDLIPPEIRPGDGLFEELYTLAARSDIRFMLDIGASSGEGSTAALVKGTLDKRPGETGEIFAIELAPARYTALVKRYEKCPFVHPIWGMAAAEEVFASEDEIKAFKVHRVPLDQILGWRRADRSKVADAPNRMIERIMAFAAIDTWDLVVIDGCEFSASAELDLVYGARYIALDDICAFKNARNYARLLDNQDYGLRHARLDVRNGWAIFYHRGKE